VVEEEVVYSPAASPSPVREGTWFVTRLLEPFTS